MPLLEEVGYVPKWKYAPGEEIREHAQAVARHFGLYDDACFQTEATELRWDDDASEWTVSTDRGDRIRARYVVVSSGTLSQAEAARHPGHRDLRGPHLPHQPLGLRLHRRRPGRRPAPARRQARGPHRHGRDRHPGRPAPRRRRTAAVRLPAHALLGRRPRTTAPPTRSGPSRSGRAGSGAGWRTSSRSSPAGRSPRTWWTTPGPARARLQEKLIPTDAYADVPAEERERAYEIADFQKMNEIRARVDALVEDPETAEKLKPWYRYMCKRPTFSDHYLQTFNRPNVTLVDTADTHGVERITDGRGGGRRCRVRGRLHHLRDRVRGGCLRGDVRAGSRCTAGTASACWSPGRPRARRRSTGSTATASRTSSSSARCRTPAAVNYVHILDEQATHVAEVVAEAREAQGAVASSRPPRPQEEWVATIRREGADLHAFQAECTPGYYNNEGRPRARSESFGDGPVAFHELLREWRAERRHGRRPGRGGVTGVRGTEKRAAGYPSRFDGTGPPKTAPGRGDGSIPRTRCGGRTASRSARTDGCTSPSSWAAGSARSTWRGVNSTSSYRRAVRSGRRTTSRSVRTARCTSPTWSRGASGGVPPRASTPWSATR